MDVVEAICLAAELAASVLAIAIPLALLASTYLSRKGKR